MSFEEMNSSIALSSSPLQDLLPVSLSGGLSKYYQPLFVPSEPEWNEFDFETEEDQLFDFHLTFSFDVADSSNEFEESMESNSSSDLIRVGKATNALEKAFCDSISAEVYSKSLGDEERESYRNHWKDGLNQYWLWDKSHLDEQIDSIESEIAKVNEAKKKFLTKSNGTLSPTSSSQNTPIQSQDSFSLMNSTSPSTPVASLIVPHNEILIEKPKIVTVSPPSKPKNKVTSKSNITFDHSPETVKKTITISTPSTIHHQRTRIEHVEESSDEFVLDIIDTDQLAVISPVQQRPFSKSGVLFPTSPLSSCHNSGTESPGSSQEESSFCLEESSHFFPSPIKTSLPLNMINRKPVQMVKSQSSTLPIGKKRMSKEEPSYIPSSKANLISLSNKRARTKQVSEIFKLEQIHRVQAISPDDENEEIDIL
eukprot:TRINITY_DN5529_c2_g1_i1.p1 TRINITY_DN5529_c2_g1~~TRINITY_DN5529_c2_g1_i1.p1  ORF type:complete len:425 (+),score=180.39 TRINITY_DN5529_c2_g1_i1:220-1494(+)